MKFLRRIAGIFGLLKDESHEEEDEDDDRIHQQNSNPRNNYPRPPTKGFSVQVPVTVDRAHLHLAPLLTPSNLRDGGVQGLRWYARRLRIDEDGDVADEFLEEILPKAEMPSNTEDVRATTKFEVKYRTRPAKVRTQAISVNGKVQHSVEHQGKLLLV